MPAISFFLLGQPFLAVLSLFFSCSSLCSLCPAHPAFFFSAPNNVITFPRSFTTPFNAPVGILKISSNRPVIAVKNSSMLSNRSRVYASPCGLTFSSCTHSARTRSVGSISRRFRSSETIRKISQTSLMDSKWSRRSPSTCTTRTIPHPCSSRKLVLTFDRATDNVLAISSAGTGRGERNSSACTCATVRLIPHRVPISPQCKMNFCATGVSVPFVVALISTLAYSSRRSYAPPGCSPAKHSKPDVLRTNLLPPLAHPARPRSATSAQVPRPLETTPETEPGIRDPATSPERPGGSSKSIPSPSAETPLRTPASTSRHSVQKA